METCEFVLFITAVACSISKCYSNEELPVIAAAFTQIGDTLATILAKEEFITDLKEKESKDIMNCIITTKKDAEE